MTFYQIRIYTQGAVEIFQNVFRHEIKMKDGIPVCIDISWSSSKNAGYCTNSRRPGGWYDLQIVNNPQYEPTADRPTSMKITIH